MNIYSISYRHRTAEEKPFGTMILEDDSAIESFVNNISDMVWGLSRYEEDKILIDTSGNHTVKFTNYHGDIIFKLFIKRL